MKDNERALNLPKGYSLNLLKVGGSEIEQAIRTAPINGCEMDKRWFLN